MSTSQPPIWDHDRNCVMASCLVSGDRWSIERVATFFDVSVTTARVMVDRGDAIKGARLTAPARERSETREEAKS